MLRYKDGRQNDRVTQEAGRVTNAKTRPIAINEYKQAINTGLIKEQDERIVKELHTFIYNEQMREEAQVGYHDDGIMSDAIGRQMRKSPLGEY